MAKVLFISNKDLKRYSILNGNTDPDKFLQYIEIAEEIHIQNYLGTKLFNKLKSDINEFLINSTPSNFAVPLAI